MAAIGASALLGMNEQHPVAWKGRTFVQISSSIQMNQKTYGSYRNTLRAQPLAIRRREAASIKGLKNGNPRVSIRIEELTSPGGYLVSTSDISCSGVHTVFAPEFTSGITDYPSLCTSSAVCPGSNALTRVRSAGMIPRNYNINRNNDRYCTSSREYLTARNKTFQQNQFAYLRKGNALEVPGTGLSSNNVYSAGGLSHCALTVISATLGNNTFSYKWIDGSVVTVTIPDGNTYDIGAFNTAFQNVQYANKHYFVNKSTGAPAYAMSFSYDTYNGWIQFQSYPICPIDSYSAFPSTIYSLPVGRSWNLPTDISNSGSPQPDPNVICPIVTIPNTNIQQVVGYPAGTYPSALIYYFDNSGNPYPGKSAIRTRGYCQRENPPGQPYNHTDTNTLGYLPFGLYDISFGSPAVWTNTDICAYASSAPLPQVYHSTIETSLLPNYVTANYKPSNPKFATQGAVDGGSYVDRRKYNSITTTAALASPVWGQQTADAFAYGVAPWSDIITNKWKYGYPLTSYPSYINGQRRTCSETSILGG
jgi:hypothetical protein